MFKQILVPLDGSALAECVLPHTIAMAHAFHAQVNLVQVLEQPSAVEAMPLVDPLTWRLKKTEADLYLGDVKARLEQNDLHIDKEVLEGNSVDQILKFAHDKGTDLMIVSSHGQHDQGFGAWNVSSTVQQMLQRGRTSTLIVRARRASGTATDALNYERLLVPLDGSRRAESVLPIATTLAQSHQAEILLVHVVTKPEMPRRMPLTEEDIQLANHLVERNQAETGAYLEQLKSRLPPNTRIGLYVSDNVAATLQDIAEREQSDLMILSAHGYSGEARWPHGSVTNRFISDGTTPLLIIQDLPPETLDSPQIEYATRQPER